MWTRTVTLALGKLLSSSRCFLTIYTADKNFARPPVAPVAPNINSVFSRRRKNQKIWKSYFAEINLSLLWRESGSWPYFHCLTHKACIEWNPIFLIKRSKFFQDIFQNIYHISRYIKACIEWNCIFLIKRSKFFQDKFQYIWYISKYTQQIVIAYRRFTLDDSL